MNVRMVSIAAWTLLLGLLTAGGLLGSYLVTQADSKARAEAHPPPLDFEVEWERLGGVLDTAIAQPHADVWTGQYQAGFAFEGTTFRLVPASGFALELRSCMGPLVRSFGTSQQSAHRIDLHALAEQHEFSDVTPDSLYTVEWGERHYLIAPGQLASFARAINFGVEPRCSADGEFLLKQGDEARAAEGAPLLPDSARGYIRTTPLHVHSTRVELVENTAERGPVVPLPERVLRYRITLSSGRRDGISEGLELQDIADVVYRDHWQAMRVIEVSETESVALYTDSIAESFRSSAPEDLERNPVVLIDHPNRGEMIGPLVGAVYTTGSSMLDMTAQRCPIEPALKPAQSGLRNCE
ncbi:MAG: hypothetical protein ABI411_20715 [Tahibacter sp.]